MAHTLAAPPKGRAMERILCFGSLAVAILVLLLFFLDLVAGFPFGGGPFRLVDILGIIAAGIVTYMALNVMRELK